MVNSITRNSYHVQAIGGTRIRRMVGARVVSAKVNNNTRLPSTVGMDPRSVQFIRESDYIVEIFSPSIVH